jgi:hypothetical protein
VGARTESFVIVALERKQLFEVRFALARGINTRMGCVQKLA